MSFTVRLSDAEAHALRAALGLAPTPPELATFREALDSHCAAIPAAHATTSKFRCSACAREPERCASCRKARNDARTAERDRHTREGMCVDCTDPPVPGTTRCRHHLDAAAERAQNYRARQRAAVG